MKALKISIVGSSGSGKSTLGRRISAELGIPHLELDAVYHQADWQPLEDTAFQHRVSQFMDENTHWVIDGNYPAVRASIWTHATQVLWLDLPRRRSIRRLLWRSIKRGVTRQTLWNGNKEKPFQIFDLNPEENVVLWAWTHHAARQKTYGDAMSDGRWGHLRFHRLREQREIDGWVRAEKRERR